MEKDFFAYIGRFFKENLSGVDLSPEAMELIKSKVRIVRLSKGEFFLTEGDISKDWGFVQEGLLRIYYKKGEEEVTELLAHEGHGFLDYESFFRQTPSKRYIQMLEPTTLYLFPKAGIADLCNEYPEIRFFFRKVLEMCMLKAKQRTLTSIFESAKDRYDNLIKECPEFILRVPSIYIASYLGITPETLSRIRSKVK